MGKKAANFALIRIISVDIWKNSPSFHRRQPADRVLAALGLKMTKSAVPRRHSFGAKGAKPILVSDSLWRQLNRCFLGSYTGVTFDSDSTLVGTGVPSLNTSILSRRILARIKEMAKVDFQIFQSGSVGCCGSTTWNYAARKLGNL